MTKLAAGFSRLVARQLARRAEQMPKNPGATIGNPRNENGSWSYLV
jgi:hypothetical protein